MYRITIDLVADFVADGLDIPPVVGKVYERTLAEIDLPKLIVAIEAKPRKRREKKEAK